MTLLTTSPHTLVPTITDAFCLRLTLAILYRAGLDAMDSASPDAGEAQEFLNSDFAVLALTVLLSKSSRDIDFGDVSDYLGHYQRIGKQRELAARATSQSSHRSIESIHARCSE